MREVAVFIVPEAVYGLFSGRRDTFNKTDAHAWTPAAETSNVTGSSVSAKLFVTTHLKKNLDISERSEYHRRWALDIPYRMQ